MIKVLVVEDNLDLKRLLELELTHAGYEVFGVDNGNESIDLFFEEEPDIVLLDIMLPDIDGFEVAQMIRKENKSVGIILLTALDQKKDKLKGFGSGVDDYMTKPFEIEELKARIESLLRRMGRQSQESLIYEGLKIDTDSKSVTYEGKAILLSKREYELLYLFIKNPGKVLSKEEIIETIWGYDYEGNQNIVEVYVNFLRNKLGEPGQWIHTARGWGYRLDKGSP